MSATLSLRRYHARWHRWARFVAQRLILRPVIHTITDVTVEGTDNLDGLRGGPFVVVANHTSHLDATVSSRTCRAGSARYAGRGRGGGLLLQVWWRKAPTSLFFNAFPVHRTGAARQGAGRAACSTTACRCWCSPRAPARATARWQRFKPGAAALCMSQDVPCMPVALVGAAAAMPAGRSWPVPRPPGVYVIFGQPMRPRPARRCGIQRPRSQARIADHAHHASTPLRARRRAAGPGPIIPAMPDKAQEEA